MASAAGTGTANGGGATRLPKSRGSVAWTQIGATADGEGPDGTTDRVGGGALRGNGEGFIAGNNNGDCTPALGGGNCSLTQNKRCFLDPITAQGQPGQDGAVLVSTFCAPPTTNTGVNQAGGAPGPGRLSIDWDFNGLCSDGVTPWELGGANCP